MMFAPERMRKVTVIGPQGVMDKAIKELYRIKAVHISDHRKDESLDIGSPFERAGRLSALLVAIRAVSSALGVSGKSRLSNGFRAIGVKSLSELERAVKKLHAEVAGILSGKKDAEDELRKLASREAQLLNIKMLDLSLDALSGSRSLSRFIGNVKDAKRLETAVSAITDRFEMAKAGDKESHIVAVFVDAARRDEVADALAKCGFSEIQLNELQGMSGSAEAALDAIAKRKDRLQKDVAKCEKSMGSLGVKWSDFLLLGEQLIGEELEKAEAPLRLGMGSKFFVLRGWVPSSEMKNLESNLSRATGEKIFVESELPHHGDSVPVRMDNPKPARPFEFFMRLYALPRYDEIDPTLFMFVTFPLFFGFILGDVGYGLVTFFLLLWLKEKFGPSSLINLMIPSAISSIMFGFVFGEVFGFEHAFGMEFPRLISRVHDINTMLFIAVAVGLLQINLGFVLGFINELRHKGLFRAFAAKLSWIILQIGTALIALSATGRINIPVHVGMFLALSAVILIYIGESMRGIIELPGLLSNLLSYARLMAVGLSSVSLAVVVNDMAKEIAHTGVVGVVASVLLLFIGHTMNLALGLLGGFLQSLRLHYVEFFTKFFEGGAFPFKPFGSKGGE